MLKHWKALTATAGSITAILGMLIAWQQLGLPTPAWSADIKAIGERVDGIEALLLSQTWERKFLQLRELEVQQRDDPQDRHLQARIDNLTLQLEQAEKQLEALNR